MSSLPACSNLSAATVNEVLIQLGCPVLEQQTQVMPQFGDENWSRQETQVSKEQQWLCEVFSGRCKAENRTGKDMVK